MKKKGLLALTVMLCGSVLATDVNNLENVHTKLEFIEELRFGNDAEDEFYIWPGQIVYLAVSDDGHILVGDQIGTRVLEYDENGRLVKQIAARGEGPGELVNLAGLQVLTDGRLAVFDQQMGNPAFKIYSKDWVFEKLVSVKAPKIGALSAMISANGQLIGTTFNVVDRSKGTLTEKTGFLDLELNVKKELSAFEMMLPGSPKSGPEFWPKFFANIINISWHDKGLFAFGNDGSIYTARRGAYRIARLNDRLEEELVFTAPHQDKVRTEAEVDSFKTGLIELYRASYPPAYKAHINNANVDKAMELARPNLVKPALLGLIAMEDGRVLAITEDNPVGSQKADVFDREGRLIARVQMGERALLGEDGDTRMVFRNGKAYTVLSDGDGENYVGRFAYKLK